MLVRAFDRCTRAWLARAGLRGAATAAVQGRALPEPVDSEVRLLRCASGDTVAYADDGAGTTDGTTFVAVHGSPGSARDWRYLVPVLTPGARVVRLELPGNGAAPPWDESSFNEHPPDAERFARAVVEACDALGLWEAKPIILAQSVGGEVALQVASKRPDDVGGLAFVCAVGLRPHRGIRTRPIMRFILAAAHLPVVGAYVPEFFRWATVKVAGYPRRTPASECMLMGRRVLLLDFERQRRAAAMVRERGIPCFTAYATDDPIVEASVSRELSLALTPGPRLAFDQGGHNVQKTCAWELGEALLAWARDLRR